MNAPRRWVETDSGARPLERALLRGALDVEAPEGIEERIWARLVALGPVVAAGGAELAGSAAQTSPALKSAASAASAAHATTPSALASGAAKIGVGMIVKSVAVGAIAGTMVLTGYTGIDAALRRGTETPAIGRVDARSTKSPSGGPSKAGSALSIEQAPAGAEPTSTARFAAVRATTSPPAAAPSDVLPSAVSAFAPLPSDQSQPKSKLGEEAQLLRRAREALRRGDLPAASNALDTATHTFPRGALTEEREALSIELLARSGQREAARLRAQTFLRAFPESPYAANVRTITE